MIYLNPPDVIRLELICGFMAAYRIHEKFLQDWPFKLHDIFISC